MKMNNPEIKLPEEVAEKIENRANNTLGDLLQGVEGEPLQQQNRLLKQAYYMLLKSSASEKYFATEKAIKDQAELVKAYEEKIISLNEVIQKKARQLK